MTQRTVLVTGAGGGLGGATAALFARRGWRVLAADLRQPEAAPNLVPIEIDVTDTDSVARALATVEAEAPEGLDAVITFAGIMHVGPLVEIDDDSMRRMFEVNVLGTYRVVKAAFPLVLRRRGRVITISSETGWQKALMLNGPYAMTKHAIEAYSDALRRELMFLGIPVSKIQPGPFRTDMVGGIRAAFDRARGESTYFARLIDTVGSQAANEQHGANEPEVLAEVAWKAASSARPKRRYSVRPDRRRTVMHRLPDAVLDPLLQKLLGR